MKKIIYLYLLLLLCVGAAAQDRSDGPTSYGQAIHTTIASTFRIGALGPDADGASNIFSTNADFDDLNGTDDEDAIPASPIAIFRAGGVYSVSITFARPTANATDNRLIGWLDINDNGVFETGEGVRLDLTAASGTAILTWTWSTLVNPIPTTSTRLHMRLRYTSDATVTTSTPTGTATNGEVEDHFIPLGGVADVGDGPSGYGVAAHLQNTNVLRIGANTGLPSLLPDYETTTLFSANADGDDLNASDDEDGIAASPASIFRQGGIYTLGVTVSRPGSFSSNNRLSAWLDLNNNGVFEASEYQQLDNNASATVNVTWIWNRVTNPIPIAATRLLVRLRFYSVTENGSIVDDVATTTLDERSIVGAVNGEVEDHYLPVTSQGDYGDAPASYGDAVHGNVSASNRMGTGTPDIESSPRNSSDAMLDDNDGLDDENGLVGSPVILSTGVNFSASVNIRLNANLSGWRLIGWLDYNNNGIFETSEAVEVPIASSPSAINSNVTVNWTGIPAIGPAVTGVFARFRFTSDATVTTATPASVANDGEVEDYLIPVNSGSDFSDGPGLYPAAEHLLIYNNLKIGTLIDGETAALTSSNATGDDVTLFDDEDGIIIQPPLALTNTSYSIQVRATNLFSPSVSALLYGWADWNNNGTLETSERASVVVPTGTNDGLLTLTWSGFTIPPGTTRVFLRLRLTTSTNPAFPAVGTGVNAAADGEVEDHFLTISSPFACTTLGYGIQGTNAVGTDLASGSTATLATGITTNLGWAYNEADNYIYGVTATSILRYSRDFTSVIAVANGNFTGATTAAFTPAGLLYILVSGAAGTCYVADLNPISGTYGAVSSFTLNDPAGGYTNGQDWEYIGGRFWRLMNGTGGIFPVQFDPLLPLSGFTVINPGTPMVAGNNAFNAVYDDETYLYGITNTTRQLYRFNFSNPLLPTFVDSVATGFASNITDGAKCGGVVPRTDFSDAPSTYGAAQHNNISSNLRLGLLVDGEASAFSSVTADGDDLNKMDDEQAVPNFGSLIVGASSFSIPLTLANTTIVPATLFGWIDFNRNGIFETSEGRSVAVPINATTATLTWTGILPAAYTTPGLSYTRFRITTDATVTTATPSGIASNGEAEDYSFTIGAATVNYTGKVFNDANSNGIFDVSETGVSGQTIVVRDSLNKTCRSGITDANGNFSLSLPNVGANTGNVFVYQLGSNTAPPNVGCPLPSTAINVLPAGFSSATTPNQYQMGGNLDSAGINFGYDNPLNYLTSGSCSREAYLFQVPTPSQTTSDMFAITLATGGFTQLHPVVGDTYPASTGTTINAVGYNRTDNLIYGYNTAAERVVRVRQDISGIPVRLDYPAITALPQNSFNVGDVSVNGRLTLTSSSAAQFYMVEAKSSSPYFLKVIDPVTGLPQVVNSSGIAPGIIVANNNGVLPSSSDWTYASFDGNLYTLTNSRPSHLVRINPATGIVDTVKKDAIPSASFTANPAFGAVFSDPNFIYGSNNNTGFIYRASLAPPNNVVLFSQGPISGTNDGARCADAPIPLDFGDAPDSYGTTLAANGARHLINPSTPLFMGPTLTNNTDEDLDGYPVQHGALANGDNNNNVNDENALSTIPLLSINQVGNYTLSVRCVNVSGVSRTATLQGWIDFNQNGFFEPFEFASVSVPSTVSAPAVNQGFVTLSWNLNALSCDVNFLSGRTYLRLRLTSDQVTDDILTAVDDRSVGANSDGEVEDYRIIIGPVDYGDLNDAEYSPASGLVWPIAVASIKAGCTIINGIPQGNNGAVWAGAIVDAEFEPTVNVSATGDDNTGLSDEDGLTPPLIPLNFGYSYDFRVTLNSNQAGKTVYYGLWYDWNNNGNFGDDVDGNGVQAFYSGSAVTNGPSNVIVRAKTPQYSTGISLASYKIRLIVSDLPITSGMFNGRFTNGEIEDYQAPAQILPVTFGPVTAEAKNCNVYLGFSYLTQQNNKAFEIEYSTNGTLWNTLTTIGSVGNIDARNYSYVHTSPAAGANYYRIKQIDINGNYSYSKTVVANSSCDGKIKITSYPNPVHNSLTVLLPANMRTSQLRITDAVGKVITSISTQNSFNIINTQMLADGMYLIEVINGNKTVYSQKFVKK